MAKLILDFYIFSNNFRFLNSSNSTSSYDRCIASNFNTNELIRCQVGDKMANPMPIANLKIKLYLG